MEVLKSLIIIFMAGILTENYVLQQFLGICPFLGVSKKFQQASGMGIAVTFVMLVATAVTWPIQTFILDVEYTIGESTFTLGYLQTIVFILVIAALVQFVEIVLKRFIPALHKSLGVYLPLITTNCAVLGVTINNITDGYSFLESMISSLGVGLGFLLAMILFAGVRSRIENCPSPKPVRGLPITLIAASIVALAFFGFSGVVENLLG
ncbi:MAG: RnfABCDGE type electron transport complex subunit A [Clostridia bacterium]|nr:RnfABCDGE type electron transport complex subunit A [Clostridia bacterium]